MGILGHQKGSDIFNCQHSPNICKDSYGLILLVGIFLSFAAVLHPYIMTGEIFCA